MRAHGNGSNLQQRIERFFADNPDEWLTRSDAALKWAVTPKQLRDALSHLKAKNSNIRVKDGIISTHT